jgi:hypothetical protein
MDGMENTDRDGVDGIENTDRDSIDGRLLIGTAWIGDY